MNFNWEQQNIVIQANISVDILLRGGYYQGWDREPGEIGDIVCVCVCVSILEYQNTHILLALEK